METEILSYIKEAKNHGLSEQEIKQNLLNAGWEAPVVEQTFAYYKALENRLTSNKDEEFKLPAHKPASSAIIQEVLPAAEPLPELESGTQVPINTSLPFWKRRIALISSAVIILIAAGSYWFYAYGFYILVNSPNKVWGNFIKTEQDKIYQSNFSLSYSDTGSLENTENFIPGFQIKDLKLSFDGHAYQNLSDINNPQASSDFQYSFGSGNTNFSTGFKYRLVGKILYLNVGENPFLNNIFKSLANGQNVDWIKLDIGQAESLTPQERQYQDQFKQIFDSSFKADLSALWQNSEFIKLEKSLGREQVNGVGTFHLKLSLDKQIFKKLLYESIIKTTQQLYNKGGADYKDLSLTDEQMKQINSVISALVEKLEIKQFEAWIGARDSRLYRILFVSNAPSAISAIKSASQEVSGLNNDSKRLADIRQLASALELYYNDNGKYPSANTGIPQNLSPKYIGLIPTSPQPAASNCNNYYNAYWYTVDKTLQHYSYTFCLGRDTAGYKAGVNRLTQSGIEFCMDAKDKCSITPAHDPTLAPNYSSPKSGEDTVQDFVNKLEYSAEIKFDSSYINYGKTQKVDIPENAFDLMQVVKGSVQGAFIKALGN